VRVALIPTGKLEMLGLAAALQRLFGDAHEFECVPRRHDEPTTPFHSFTSARLPVASHHDRRSPLAQLVGAMVDAVWDQKFDLAVVLDDLELYNVGNEATVIAEFRAAVQRHVDRVATRTALDARKLRDRLRACASFHLVVPMIESWLFADPQGPTRAGVPSTHLPPRLRPGDPEQFATDDPEYAADDGAHCTAWNDLPPSYRERNRPEWLKPTHPRTSHPKHYMAWLCRTPGERCCSNYAESTAAVALEQLAWADVLRAQDRMQFARALVCDLADGLALDPPGVALTGQQALHTSIQTPRGAHVLRNL
jgi:hypothetical protein